MREKLNARQLPALYGVLPFFFDVPTPGRIERTDICLRFGELYVRGNFLSTEWFLPSFSASPLTRHGFLRVVRCFWHVFPPLGTDTRFRMCLLLRQYHSYRSVC